MDTRTFNNFRKLIYEKSGITLNESKEAMVSARVAKRMRALGLTKHKDYFNHVIKDEGGQEIVYLLDAISTNLTSFFREPEHFALMEELMRKWVAQGQRRFRFWSAASSSGEEPYCMAITLLEAVGNKNPDIKILATDISTQILKKAQEGIYKEERLEKVSKTLITRYFSRHYQGDNGICYQVRDELKRLIVFRRLNLSKPPFPMRGPLDAVFCRNVMIYFDNSVRARLLNEITRLLKPGGYLMVGHAESLAGMLTNLKNVRPSVYVKT